MLAASIVGSFFFGYAGEERLCLGFGHPNVLGGLSAWGVLSILALRDAYSPRLRWLAFAAAAVCVVGILLASSRSALLGLTAGSLFLFRHEIRTHFLKVLSVCLVGLAATVFLLPSWHTTRLETALRTPLNDVTFQSRLPIREAAWKGFLHAPVWGNGIQTFKAWHKSCPEQYGKTS